MLWEGIQAQRCLTPFEKLRKGYQMFLRTMVEGLYVGKAQVTVRSVFVTFEGVTAGVQGPRKGPRCHIGRLDALIAE